MISFMSDAAEGMPSVNGPATSRETRIGVSIGGSWAWFEAVAEMSAATPVPFRLFEAMGRALITAGAGVAAPASATATMIGLMIFSRRRVESWPDVERSGRSPNDALSGTDREGERFAAPGGELTR